MTSTMTINKNGIMHVQKNNRVRTLQMLLTTLTMLFTISVGQVWGDVYTFDMSKISGISSTEASLTDNVVLPSNEDANVKITYYYKDSNDKIKTNGNTFGDDVKWTGYIKTGGSTSSTNNHYLKLTLDCTATIKVYAKGGGKDRCVYITQDLSKSPKFTNAADETTVGSITPMGEIASTIIGNGKEGINGIVSGTVQAGDVYIGATNGSYFYAIVVETISTPVPTPTPSYTALADVKTATADPFGFAIANNRTTAGTTPVTGGGMHDIDDIMTALGDYTAGTPKVVNDKNVVVLQSDGTEMASTVTSAINTNDVIILDGAGTSTDFIIGSVMKLNGVSNKTILGINGARLCTQWYLTADDRTALDAVPVSGGKTGVKNASTSSGTGGTVNGNNIDEEAEYLTRKTLFEKYGNENYKNAGVFEFYNGSNIIIRNIQFVGPGSVDVGGYDLLGFKNMTNSWVDHCEFTDGIDGNFDITEQSNFVTVSWCKFSYTNRSYVHQNTNLVGGSDSKLADVNKLNITFAYNQWGEGCNARMPMARYGKIHLINNYYTCTGNGTSCVNPRTQSEVLLDANHWISGIKKVFEPGTDTKAPTAYTWSNTNVIKDASPSKGAPASDLGTVTVPYDYSAMILDPETLPTVIPANGGAVLYDNTPKSSEKKLTKAVFSNGFNAFINESAHTVTAYYMQGESVPTLVTKEQSEKATTSIAGNTITVTAEDGTTQDYALTLTAVAPYTTTGERQFDGTETWIKTGGGYATEASSKTYYAWVINKNAEDGRIQLGKTRIYFFVGNSDKVTLINDRGTSLSSDRNIKVYVNGEEKSTPTSMHKYNSETPASIDIETGGPAMIEIAANQTSGDTGWGKIIVTPKSEEPKDIVLYDLKTGVGSAEVTATDATVTAAASLALSSTTGRIKLSPKDGEKFKNGDKVEFSGTIGNTSKNYGLKIFAADGTTSAGELKVAGTTNPLKVSGTLTLSADADYIFIGCSDGTTTTMTDMTISRPGSTPTPTYPITAMWDFTSGTSACTQTGNNKASYPSDVDGVALSVTYTGGELKPRAPGNADAQINATTTIKIPVTSVYDEIIVTNYDNEQHRMTYTLGGVEGIKDEVHPYSPSAAEVSGGFAILTVTVNGYFKKIKVVQQGAGYEPEFDWTPTWDGEKWTVKLKENGTDVENAKGLTEALKYLNVAANVVDKNKTLFIPNGTYDLGETALTTVPADMHLIGESQDGVIIKNQLPFESIKYTATLKITGANVTLENMTIKCRATYGKEKKDDNGTIQDSSAERGVCIQDCGNGSHYINVTLDGLQDTYYSNGAAGMTATFDNCIVRGNVDFFCGSGDITVNNSRLQIVSTHGSGGTAVICAPATYTNGETQGYVFNNCVVEAATSAVDCVTPGHSTNLKFALARAWYNGNDGTDKTPRVTFRDTEFEIKPNENWTTMSPSQPGGAPVFQIINTGVQFTDEAKVIDKTNKPFAYATANDRTNPASVSASNITGGGEYDLETIMQKMEAGGGYTPGTAKEISTSNGTKKAIVLKSANTTENGKEKRIAMDQTIIDAINNNDIIVFDGNGYNDFVVKSVMTFRKVENKTVVGINGARLCTEWYLTDYFKSILENVPTSSGTGVNSASTAEGTGGSFIGEGGKTVEINEEGEYLTRKYLYEAVGNEDYRYSGIFYLGACKNWIIRNLKLVGPGSLDCAGYDLMAIIDSDNGTKFSDHMWVDHCEFVDGMDGNFDITNGSDFVTVSWCQFRYTDRSYAHQNTNLVGSSDDKGDMDRGKLNITFAYNEWGANCRARMPMARFGRIHMLNNYYNCAGNSEYAMNPRKESEFLVEGNYWEKGVRRAYNPNGQNAVTWGSNNFYADKAADKAGSSNGATVTVPYQYSALMLDPMKVPEVVTLNGGAKLYKKPYFTTNLGVADNTPGTQELQHNVELTEELKTDGLVFSVWAENAHTFQWYKQDIDLEGNVSEWEMLDGEQRNTYTFKPVTGITFNIKCIAFGVSGEKESDVLNVNIDGLSAPYYLGGMPEEMQTVYTGTPMTFTANFKDAQGYQWYKNTTNEIVVDEAHKIAGATSNTYTYNPESAEIFYLYCAASNSNGKGDGCSNNVKVKGIKRDVKFHYYGDYNYAAVRSEEVVVGGTGGLETFHTDCATTGTKCVAGLNSMGEDALHNKVSAIRFASCATTHDTETKFAPNTYVKFTLNNALVAGQTIKLNGYTSSTDSPNEKFGFYVCTAAAKTAENTVVTLKFTQKKNTLNEIEATVPESCAGAIELYVIPFVDKESRNISLHELMVYDGETVPADDPTVTVVTESPVSAKVGNEVIVRITVTDAESYQWYKNSTEELVFDEEHKIAGQTNANLSYTPEAEGTEYVYCRVIGKKADTHVDTPIIQLNISEASASQSGTLAVTWPLVDGSNKYTAAPAATLTGDITVEDEVLVSKDNVGTGSKLQAGSNGAGGTKNCTFSESTVVYYGQYTVTEKLGSNTEVNSNLYVKFTFTPKVSFKPEKISFLATVNGTGDGCFQPVLVYGNGVSDKKNLSEIQRFKRDSNVKPNETGYSYDISDITVDPNTPVSLYLYVGGVATGKSICFKDVKIEGQYIKEELTQCLTPSVVKGNWDAEHQQWKYTLSCAQPETAKIHYKIGDADAVEAPTNPVTINVSEDVAFSVWASDPETDPEAKLKDSKTVEMTGEVRPQLDAPSILFATYKVDVPANRGFLVTLTDNNEGVENVAIHYTIDGSEPTTESAAYTAPFLVGGDVTVKAIATKTNYASSKEESAKTLPVNSEGSETTTRNNTNNHYSTVGENVGFAYTYNDNDKTVQNANKLSDGLKFTTNATLSIDGKKGFAIKVNPGFVITKVVATKATTNNDAGSMTFGDVYVDGEKNGTLDKKLPFYGGSNDANAITFTVAENIAAKDKIEVEVTSADVKNNQANVLFTVFYEFDDAPAVVTITDSKDDTDVITLDEAAMTAFKSSHEYTVNVEKMYAEDPIVKITTEKGYEYIVPAGDIETEGDKLTHFTKSFVGVTYTVKAKVNAVKSPNIEIAENMSLKGGYKVTLTYSKEDGIYPYIKIGDSEWEQYDPEKEYYALSTVQSKMKYGEELESETVARQASCPSNSYTAGKPFAVFIYVNNYDDKGNGQTYNTSGLSQDKIHSSIAESYNIIDLPISDSDAILEKRPDITDAKLVVISETIGGSGSTEIAGVGNKSNMMALTLKRDVVDKTNVINFKMFTYGSSSANDQRWMWALPVAMPSAVTSIKPLRPSENAMFDLFSDAITDHDGNIVLWDDIDEGRAYNHLQPVSFFNEENLEAEGREFTPLAMAVNPDFPDDEYHILHYYEKGAGASKTTYVGFGLSVNEWQAYNNNLSAIVGKMAKMIAEGRSLNSPVEGLVPPKVTDNGDGSALVMNNNQNATTYYMAVDKGADAPTKEQIKAANIPDERNNTIKYDTDKVVYAVSELGGTLSDVVSGEVAGNSIRYVIRENDDPEAQGLMAKYPFDLTVNSGTFNMPYNQSWKKDGYTVKEWEVVKSSDPSLTSGTRLTPGTSVSGLTQDITVKAVWTENTHKITDLGKDENPDARTVTWEFLQSKGAPALAMESKAGNMQAVLVGQVKFHRDSEHPEKVTDWIDVPMTINTDHNEVLPDDGNSYHGKFNNVSTNWAESLVDGYKEYAGSDYTQVRTGTQFTFPAVYGMNVNYKQIDLVESVKGEANGNVNRSQISQSYITDGTITGGVANVWNVTNAGYQLDSDGKIVRTDGVAQLNGGGNAAVGGNFDYQGEARTATLTSRESAQYVHTGTGTGKTTGTLNLGSVFMQSLSVTYPALYDLTCTWNPAKSEIDPRATKENPGKIEKLTDSHINCDDRYLLGSEVRLKLTPAYGYYVGEDTEDDPATEDVDESYYFFADGTKQFVPTTGEAIYRYKDSGYNSYSDDIKANIPVDGAYIVMKVQDMDLVVSMKKYDTYTYKFTAYPGSMGEVNRNTGNGRSEDDEYMEYPAGKTIVVTAAPKIGCRFVGWKRGDHESTKDLDKAEIPGITFGDGTTTMNPLEPSKVLEKNQLAITVGADNATSEHSENEYTAIFEKGVTGTANYLLDKALLQTVDGEGHVTLSAFELTEKDKNVFPPVANSTALNIPYYYTLFKEGYTLDRWLEIQGTWENKVFTPTLDANDKIQYGKSYSIGTFYYFEEENEVHNLVPVFTQNSVSYDHRATEVDITWDFRSAKFAQQMSFDAKMEGGKYREQQIFYSTHAKINNGIMLDVPLKITLGNKGKLKNDNDDEWCAIGEGTEILIPSGVGAKFTIASLSKMTTTNIDGVVPTSYTPVVENGVTVYYYTYTTQSPNTTVKLTIGNDYSYYKSIRAQLPAADKVTFNTFTNNTAYGVVEIKEAKNTENNSIKENILPTRSELQVATGAGQSYTLGLGTTVTLEGKRERLYAVKQWQEITYTTDEEGNRTEHVNVIWDSENPTEAAPGYTVDLNQTNTITGRTTNLLTFQVTKYDTNIRAIYGENKLYQVNYTSGDEAEGEAPGVQLIEEGESFTIPAANHHLYVDGQTLKYWKDDDGKIYNLGQSYKPGEGGVPEKDLYLTPCFKVNAFTVMNLKKEVTVVWPLTRQGSSLPSYSGNGDVSVYIEGTSGVYVTPLVLTDEGGEPVDTLDLKLDLNAVNSGAKVDNRNAGNRCQVNANTVIGVPSSSNCTITIYTANSELNKTKIDGKDIATATVIDGNYNNYKKSTNNYSGDKSMVDIEIGENTYLYQIEAVYKPAETELPELNYATVGNISLGALGTSLAGYKLSTLKSAGKVEGVPADLSNSTTGIMPVVRGTATRGGYVDVTQATIDNPVATMLVKTRDGVTVSVHKIEFTITYPNQAPKVTDLKIDRKFQCDLKKMYDNAIKDTRVDSTNYLNDEAYLRHLGVDGENAENERVAINGVINIKFNTKMAAVEIPADGFNALNGKMKFTQAIKSEEGQTLTFSYWGLDTDTEYDFEIHAGTLKDVFWAESSNENKPNHVYNQTIRFHFTTVENATSNEHRVVNFVVTHNQASAFNTTTNKMEATGSRQPIASEELIANLGQAGIKYGTLDEGIALANKQVGGSRFYIFVPDGEYQLMGNEVLKSVSSGYGESGDIVITSAENVYNAITAVSHDNVSITGQSMDKTIVWNKPYINGGSNTSTLKLNGGITNFYAQDLTLENRFDYQNCVKKQSKAEAVALWDRSQKSILKDVALKSYQMTIRTNSNSTIDDTRGYYENCKIYGFYDLISGDGNHWFQDCDLIIRQGKMSQVSNIINGNNLDTHEWGFVLDGCSVSAENNNNSIITVNNEKMTIGRPDKNSPAMTLLHTKFNLMPTAEGYKKQTANLVLRMQEYRSTNGEGALLDLNSRSLRSLTPAVGSYDAVMAPSRAAQYNIFNVMGGEDGYDPTLHTRQVNMSTNKLRQDDTSLSWDKMSEALCYFIFRKENGDWKLFAVTADTEFELDDKQINKTFMVRAANQRGGLGDESNELLYQRHENYERQLANIPSAVIDGWRWSTIYLDFNAKAPVVQHEEVVDGKPEMVDDIFVYSVVKVGATSVTLKRVKVLEAGRGYIIKARPRPENYVFKYTEKVPVYWQTDAKGNNLTLEAYVAEKNKNKKPGDEEFVLNKHSLLSGTIVNITAPTNSGYTLGSKQPYGLGFFKYTGKTYSQNLAWLDAALVAKAQQEQADKLNNGNIGFDYDDQNKVKAGYCQFIFEDDIIEEQATDIDGVLDADDADDILLDQLFAPGAIIYNIHGQRVNTSQMQRDQIYIFQGKKIRY